MTGSTATETTVGLDRNLAAPIAYFFLAFSGLVLLAVEEDAYVRFHAAQSVVLTVAFVVLEVTLGVVGGILGQLPLLGGPFGLLVALVSGALQLAMLAVWVFLLFKAYTGVEYELPSLGGFARRLA